MNKPHYICDECTGIFPIDGLFRLPGRFTLCVKCITGLEMQEYREYKKNLKKRLNKHYAKA